MNKTNLRLIFVFLIFVSVSLVMINIRKNKVNNFTGIQQSPTVIDVKNRFGEFSIDLSKKTINGKKAPENLIDTISKKLEDINVVRRLNEFEDLKEYGLDLPKMEVELIWPDRKLSLLFGNRNPHNQGIYAFYREKVFILDTFFFHEINKDLLNIISEVKGDD